MGLFKKKTSAPPKKVENPIQKRAEQYAKRKLKTK